MVHNVQHCGLTELTVTVYFTICVCSRFGYKKEWVWLPPLKHTS